VKPAKHGLKESLTKTVLSGEGRGKIFNPGLINKLIKMERVSAIPLLAPHKPV